MSPKFQRDAYKDAIDKVRSEHGGAVTPSHGTLECPRCGTRQVIHDVPGMRRCVQCGFEFRPSEKSRAGRP